MNKWILIHTYQNLAEDGKASPLKCPDCDGPLISMIDSVDTKNEDPVLWCPSCDHRSKPGLDFWDQVTAVVKEHHDI
jgi:hypothetical protein